MSEMNITVKRLTECTIQDAITAWNRGFEGYFVQMDMTPELFFNRLANEGLSLSHSLVAFDKQQPVAIVLNGFRTVNGQKISWNGGTGVAVEYRGKGVSKLIMEETLKVYDEEGVEAATLEAIKENEKAIRLYEKFGYKITDHLVYLTCMFEGNPNTEITARSIRPEQIQTLAFYNENVPWQCQWQSVKSGEAQVYYIGDKPIGYSLFKRVWNQEGKLEKVFLFQIELFQEVTEESMNGIFAKITDEKVNYLTINAAVSNPVTKYLMEKGFVKTTEQVRMIRKMK